MEEEDYFGPITVPDDEAEEDAANDLTFGDIGDIKAGDDSSDAMWKSDHHNLSRKIEQEKQALQRSQDAPPSYQFMHTDLYENHPPNRQNLSSQNSDAVWDRLSEAVKSTQTPLTGNEQMPDSQSLQPPLASPATLNMNMPRSLPLAPTQQPQAPTQQPQLAAQEYERAMIAYYEQQTRQLLLRHRETAEVQLREAIAAQRAGVVFDRAKFDEHQNAARQRIINEFYARVYQIRYLTWLQTRQMTQQNESVQLQSTSPQLESGNSPVAFQAQKQDNIIRKLMPDAFRNNHATSPTNAHTSAASLNLKMDSAITPALLDKDPDVQREGSRDIIDDIKEIERRLRESSLITKATNEQGAHEKGRMKMSGESSRERSQKVKKGRRLESMTDKDQELVFRVHLRQVESAVTYKDDYYHGMYQRNEKLGVGELYDDLAKRTQEMRLRNRLRGGEGRSQRLRRSRRASHQPGQPTNPTQASDTTKNPLANALGSVQTWNPRAPRRVMDFSSIERKKKPGNSKLLRDDERVKVRHEIERGYDIIANIHDIVRGESSEALEEQIRLLFKTLHTESEEEEDKVDSLISGTPSLRFFGTLCVLEKGRRYLARVLDILDISERIRVMPSVFESLGPMLYSLQRSRRARRSEESDIMSRSMQTIGDSCTSALDCVSMLSAFHATHASRPDAFLTTFRNASGAKLMYLCMQRISRGIHKNEIDESEIVQAGLEDFAKLYTETLQRMFEGAELVNRVWEMTASLDSILTGDSRSRLRTELNRLLQCGVAPPPPEG